MYDFMLSPSISCYTRCKGGIGKLLLVILFLNLCSEVSAHGTQVAYCVTDGGKIRVYIEHWHGNISPPSVVNAPVTIDVMDNSTGVTTTFMSLPDGVVWDTNSSDLPDCKGPLNVVSSCPGRANLYNDWVYWDFAPPACFVNLTITVVRVSGSQSFYFDEACAALYPVSFTDSFIDCVPPTVQCPTNITQNANTADCSALLGPELKPIIIFDDCTPLDELEINYSITGALNESGTGCPDNIEFPKGISTLVYTVTDNTDKSTTCSFTIEIIDTVNPIITCPSVLNLECGDELNGSAIADWLNSATASDLCGISNLTNDYDPMGFAFQDHQDESGKIGVSRVANISGLGLSILNDKLQNNLFELSVECTPIEAFTISEVSGYSLYDYRVKARIQLNGRKLEEQDALQDNGKLGLYSEPTSGKQSISSGPEDFYYRILNTTMLAAGSAKGSQVITFVATDLCGNTSSCTSTIIIDDSLDPVLSCPEDITLECGDPNNDAIITTWLGTANATDSCNDNPSLTNNYNGNFVGGCGNTGTNTVTFTADDGCGNTTTCSAVITIVDTTAPEFLMKPQDITVECINSAGNVPQLSLWLAGNGGGMAMDDCDAQVTWTEVAGLRTELCGYTWTEEYTFTITDDCGNTSTAMASFTVEDTTPPVLNLRADITQACSVNNDRNLATYLSSYGSATDVCSDREDIDVSYVLFNSVPSCGQTREETYLFTAVDECGNSTQDFFTYKTTDTAVPTWSGPPGTLIITCNDPDNPTLISQWIEDLEESMIDGCAYPLMVTNNWDGVVNDGCTTNTVITFTVTDDCGNSRTNLYKTIQVRDRENPVFLNCPEDFTVNVDVDQCGSIVNFPTPVGYDQCTPDPNLTIVQINGPASGSTFPVGTTYVRFRVTDACNRQALCDFNITVVDSDTPSIHCPSNDVAVCNDTGRCDWLADDSVNPGVTDNCATRSTQYEISGATTLSRRNGDAEGIRFTLGVSTVCYYVEDLTGNEVSCCFDVIVSDCENPIITCPVDVTFNCDDLTEIVDETPESGIIEWNHNESGGTNYSGTNNISSLINSVNDISFGPGLQLLDNNTNPAVIPNGTTFEHVLTDVSTNSYASALAADDYVEISFTVGSKSILTQIQEGMVPTALGGSNAGNFQVAAEISDDGFTTSTLLYQNAMIGDANAIGGYVLYQETLNYILNAGSVYIVRFYLYDEQNNASMANGLSLPDNTAAFDDLQLTIEECIPSGSTQLNAWLSTAMVDDNCSTNITVESIPFNTISACGNTNITVYQFTAVDSEGNSSQCLASFTIEDNTLPVITTEAQNGNSNCDDANADLLDWLNSNGGAEANDGCGSISWTNEFLGGASTGCSGVTELSVRFTATDDCGNSVSTDANFSVNDAEAPSITCPSDITLECGDAANDAVIDLWLLSFVTADNCSEVDVTTNFDESFNADCGTTGAYNVSFIATDQCGNITSCSASIVVEDTTIPRFVMKPQDLYVECDGEGNSEAINNWLAIYGNAMVEDNCDSELDWIIEEVGDNPQCGNTTILEYNFNITDECDNSTETVAFVFIEDNTAPTLNTPEDLTVECDGAGNGEALSAWLLSAAAADVCSDEFAFTTEIYNNSSACGGGEVISYIFSASDDCGNVSTAIATYTIEDATKPAIQCPENLLLECGAPGNGPLIADWLTSATSTDVCSTTTITHNYTGVLPENCGGGITVTFISTDNCGNTEVCMADIVMNDNTIPDFVNCPNDLTINVDVDECGSNPIFSTPIAVDNCDVNVTQTEGPASGTPFPIGDTDIEFTAIDECGNTITCNFTITVVDSDVPTVVCQPNILDVCVDGESCMWASEDIGPLYGQENCPDYEVSYVISGMTNASGIGDASGVNFNIGTSTVCYTTVDSSDNEASCCFNITVTDCEAPTINCPEDLTVECDGFGNFEQFNTWLSSVTALDNCEDSLELNNMLYNHLSGCGATSTLVYEFKAEDNYGNVSVCYSSFTIEDKTNPTIETEASSLTIECDGVGNSNQLLGWLEEFGGARASDICGNITWSHNFIGNVSDLCGATGSIDVSFTATDACGNTSATVATFEIEDTTDPSILCPADITLECGDPINNAVIDNWLSSVIGNDECSEITFSQDYAEAYNVNCGSSGTYTVTFTALDECKNEASCISTITIEDNLNPSFIVDPSDLVLSCSVEGVEVALGQWLDNNGGAEAIDECDLLLDWTFEALEPIPGCGSTMNTPYIFIVTDDCGNSSTISANFITEDITNPILILPEDITIECDGAGNEEQLTEWLDSISATDDCSNDIITTSGLYNTISACGGGVTEVYLFTATDECGNQDTGIASFTIEDTTPPVIVCPENLSLECGDIANDQLILAWLNVATATDVCSRVSINTDFPGGLPEDCNGSLSVTFTAIDECGNTSFCTADILMDDTINPSFLNCPEENLVINVDVDNCSSNPIFSTPIAEDNCMVAVVQTQGPSSGTEFDLGTTLIEFTATDECGNETICQFNIIVIDSDVPMILCPSTTIVQCADENRCAWTSDKSVDPSANFENCPDAKVTYTITGVTSASGNGSAAAEIFNLGNSTVCYTIEDESENTSTCCFEVLVEDCQVPDLVCPANLILECAPSNELALNDWLNSAVASDNCDIAVELTYELWNSISGCGNTDTEEYLFIAEDNFGNISTCVRFFEIQDNTDPIILTTEPDVTVECNGNGNIDQLLSWLSDNGNISNEDVNEYCNNYTWFNNYESVTFTQNELCSDDIGYYDVIFWVVDDCGNESNKIIKRFSIEDSSEPNLFVPQDITLECSDPANASIIEAWINDVAANDLCDFNVDITFESSVVEQCGLTSTTTYSFTATDDCGNQVSESAMVIIEDNTAPSMVAIPFDLFLECAAEENAGLIASWLSNHGGAVASDLCNKEALVWIYEEGEFENACGGTGSTSYTFTVTDDCGNNSTTSASIIIEDKISPELMVPEEQLEECGNIGTSVGEWQNEVSVSDNCGEVVIDVVLWNTISDCGGTNTEQYLFTATDECGNQTTGISNYETEDTETPIIFCPADLALNCGDENNDQIIAAWLESVSAVDANDCSDIELSYEFSGGLPMPLDCNDGEGLLITFTATDECNNVTTCSATISMDDMDDPYFVNCPTNLTVNVDVDLCETNVVYSTPVALDDCDEEVSVVLIDGPTSGTPFELGVTTVTFEATDNCGNTSICTFDITVIDSDVPSIHCPSNEVVVCTDEGTCAWLSDEKTDPLFNDNCDGLVITYTIDGSTEASSELIGVNIISEDAVIFNLGTSTICYSISDPTGNSANCCFDIIVEDCEAPTITCSDLLEVPCGEEDIDEWIDAIASTIQDNCSDTEGMIVVADLITDFSSCGNTINQVYLFTVRDEAGNSSTCLATYESIDEIIPSIEVEASDLILECDGSNQSTALQAWLNNNAGASASDACSIPITWTNNFLGDLSNGCGATGEIEVIFTATDDCSNASITSAIFRIEDNIPPVISVPDNITIECGDVLFDAIVESWLNGAEAIDDCESSIMISHNYGEVFEDGCGLTGEYTITWTATDSCENTTTASATLTIEDNIVPAFILEANDLILECAGEDNDDTIADWLSNNGLAFAADECSDEPLAWDFGVKETLETCGETGSTLYEFIVTDNCGNENTTTAFVIIEDTTPPVLNLPEDQLEECDNIETSLEQWQSEATATDECGDVSINVVLWNTISDCGGSNTEQYLFTALDACGNSTTGIANYETEDTTPPEISCPENLALVCGNENNDQIILAWLESVTAKDPNGCSQVLLRYELPGGLPTLVCNQGEGLIVIFTATDECGNVSECQSIITMDDIDDPYFVNCPSDLIVNVDVDLCETNVVYSTPVSLDYCDENVSVVLIEGPASGSPFGLGTTTVVFEATDDCGNTSICSFDITVLDSDIPSIDCPSNEVLVCADEGACTWLSDNRTNPLFNDNCDGLIVTYTITGETEATSNDEGINIIAEDEITFNLGVSTICYTISDPAENTSSCCFDIIVQDCEDPTIICNDQLDIACGEEDVSAWIFDISSTIVDNCSNAESMTVEATLVTDFSSCGNTFEQVYLFTVTDVAGNQSTCLATYETDDEVNPIIEEEATDLILECDGSNQSTALQAWLNDNAGASASDVCSRPITWTNNFVGDLSNGCGASGEIEVIFTATDECGNASSINAIFRIEDNIPPALEVPEDITIECGDLLFDAIVESWLNGSSAIDNCESSVSVSHNYGEVFEDDCGLTGVHTVTWTAVDACENATSDIATITIVDNTNPEITLNARDLLLECADAGNEDAIANWLENNGGSDAIDLCSDESLVWTFEADPTVGSCGETGVTLYTFTVEDNCGNQNNSTALLIIQDTTPPILNLPENQLEECAAIELSVEDWQAEATGSDLCGEVSISVVLDNTISGCGDSFTEVYIFTVIDECGNQTTGMAEYSLEDSTNPLITVEAEDFLAECDGGSNAAEILNWLNNNGFAEAEDTCGNLSWSNNYGEMDADCGSTGEVEVTFTVEDECGNTSSTTSVFTINDTTAPTWELVPQDLEIECDGSIDPMGQIEAWLATAGGAEVEDDCSFVVYSNDFEQILLECDQEGGILVTFTATDACGNTTSEVAFLTITDDTPPEITSPAKDETVECNGLGNQEELEFWLENHAGAESLDGCSGEITWNYILMNREENCGLTSRSTYMFTATDACGNVSNNTIADFIIEDTTIPDIAEVLELIVECDGDGNVSDIQSYLDNNGGSFASDICSAEFTWEFDLVSIEETCGITNIQTYRFTVFDECMNSSFGEAIFQIEDTSPPEIVGGSDMNMEECDDPPLGNFPDFDFWLDSNAGADAADMCGNLTWSNDFHPDNWIFTCGNTRFVDVTFTAADECGNTSEITHQFGVGDVTPPIFINCPRPPLIVDAPDGWCSAYGNFEIPTATDNCGGAVTVERSDDLELNSGDLFPIGLTILEYTATDLCGNISTCELKIIVNDFHTDPTISCPEDIIVEAQGNYCNTPVDGLAPMAMEDNCPENLSVIYDIIDENGAIVNCGVLDASGESFPVGDNTLTYSAIDQPILLITEIIQDGNTTGVEITNFGPTSLDISCLDFFREGPDNETYNVLNGVVLPVGGVYTQTFSNLPVGDQAGYYISFVGKVIDGVSVNGHAATNYTFLGAIYGSYFERLFICDHDDQYDFKVGNECNTGSFGGLNQELTLLPDNGFTVGLQEGEPGIAQCSSEVSILDTSAPFCAGQDTLAYELVIDNDIRSGCTELYFTVTENMDVADIRIEDLVLNIVDASDLFINLVSPSGTSITLFNGLCNGVSGININLSDSAPEEIQNIDCNSTTGDDRYEPVNPFKTFFNENAQGTWTMQLDNQGSDIGTISSAMLELIEFIPYDQEDIRVEANENECRTFVTWRQPFMSDNCCFGDIRMEYITEDDISLPVEGDFAQGGSIGAFFEVGITTVIYTSFDQYGNESQCSFDVMVEDRQAPTIDPQFCQDLYFDLVGDNCMVPLSQILPTNIGENCVDTRMEISPDFSGGIPSGTHPVTITIIDDAGNESSCTFNVTVASFISDSDQMACIGQINLGLDADCQALITPDMMLADASMGCVDDFCIRLFDEHDELIGSSFDGTNIVYEEHIGQQIKVEVCVDCANSNCCWGYLTVEHKLTPEVVCPSDIEIACNQSFDTNITGMPAVQTCEQEIYFNYDDEFINLGMCEDPSAIINRTWYVTDESGNTITCEQKITIIDFELSDIVCPIDTIITEEYTCLDVIENPMLTHPDSTGYPTIFEVPISETGEGLCSHFWNWDDQILYNCEGSYEILRKWIIHDMCEDIVPYVNPYECYQVIKVLDDEPPVFDDCPEDLTINAGTVDCRADLHLNEYMPEIYDLCGTVQDIFVTVNPGTVYEDPPNSDEFYLTNLVPGNHVVKIRAKDQCSNYDVCDFNINVEDLQEPNVVCDQFTVVSLTTTGTAKVHAEVLDDGSWDYCTPIKLQVYRPEDYCIDESDLIPSDFVTLCCDDVQQSPIMLVLRVWDDGDYDGVFGSIGDHYGECMVEVEVQDKTVPNLQCPPDITIYCGQDFTNIELTGSPSAESVCNNVAADYVDDLSMLEDCSLGRIIRKWRIPNDSEIVECTQLITIASPDDFTEDEIVWAPDWEGSCNDAVPDNNPQFVGSSGCNQIGVSLESDTFYFESDACFKVVNHWKVANWCTGDEFENWQTLKFTDNAPPSISVSPASFAAQGECIATVRMTASGDDSDSNCPSESINWNITVDLDNDGNIDFHFSSQFESSNISFDDSDGDGVPDLYVASTGPGELVEIQLPNPITISTEQHSVIWMASDGCGNTSSEVTLFNVDDQKPPTAACINLSTSTMENGEVTLWACDFAASVDDDCTPIEFLYYSFDTVTHPTEDPTYNEESRCTSRTFTCSDLENSDNGMVEVELVVWDLSGNFSICSTIIHLLDNSGVCGQNFNPMIAGRVSSAGGNEMKEVTAHLELMDRSAAYFDETDEEGHYLFEGIEFGEDYKVALIYDGDYLNGVSTLDLIAIQQQILDIVDFDSPYQMIAADVNNDEKVSALDVIAIRKLILGIYDEYPDNDSWRFVDAKQTMSMDDVWPFSEDLYMYNVESSLMDNDFIGVKIGDVNLSAIANVGDVSTEKRESKVMYLAFEDKVFTKGEKVKLQLNNVSEERLAGFQMTLHHKNLKFISLKSPNFEEEFNYYANHKDKTTVSWGSVNGVIPSEKFSMDIEFEAEVDGTLSDYIFVSSEITKKEAYLTKPLRPVELQLEGIPSEFVVSQNTPNPFTDFTQIELFIPQSSNVELQVFDLHGRLVYTKLQQLDIGKHIIEFSERELGNSSGVFTVQFEYLDKQEVIKMISIK